jgi:hypothetical protein
MGGRIRGTGAWVFGVGCGICAAVAFLSPPAGRYPLLRVSEHAYAESGMDGASTAEEQRDWGPIVPADIRRILQLDPHAAREEERQAVLRFVRVLGFDGESAPAREGDLRWVADAVLTWLRRGSADADALALELAALARKENTQPELRESVLVHLGLCRVNDTTRERVGQELSQVGAGNPAHPWVGIALGLLGRGVFVAAQPEWVRERCLELAADPQAHVLCRIAAFDLAALRGWQEAEPLARIQSVSAAAATERVAALHALAEVGNEDTLRWLEKWEPPQDPFLSACLDETRQRLRSRGPKF